MLHYTQPQCDLLKFSAKHNSKTTLSYDYKESFMAEYPSLPAWWLNELHSSSMPYAPSPAIQRNWYRECHSDITVERIYQEIFAT